MVSEGARTVGLIPAAGLGTRAGHAFSKELFPVRFRPDASGELNRPISSLQLLLEQFARAGADRVYVAIRDGKWDIPSRHVTRGDTGLDIAYLVVDASRGVPFTLDIAHAFLADAHVLMGFPDILLEPEDVYTPVLRRLEKGVADVVLGLFPPTDPDVNDQVRVDEQWRILELAPKPVAAPLDFAWATAAWRPRFTRFMRERTGELIRERAPATGDGREYSFGHLLADAIESGLRVEGVRIEDGRFQDIGTPAGLATAREVGLIEPGPAGLTT